MLAIIKIVRGLVNLRCNKKARWKHWYL